MSTKLYLHTTTQTPTVGTDTTFAADPSSGPLSIANAQTYIKATVAGPTAPIQYTVSGTNTTWLSYPLADSVTISGTVTINIRASVDNTAANATVEGRVVRVDNTGAILSTVVAVPPVTVPAALSTTDSAINYSVTPTSTAFNAGDCIGLQIYIDDGNAVTMTSGHTVTISINSTQGISVGAGDTWFQFTEQLVFKVNGALQKSALADLPSTRTKPAYLQTGIAVPGTTTTGTYIMRAVDTTLSATVYWSATILDTTGSQYTGPGPLTGIVRVI